MLECSSRSAAPSAKRGEVVFPLDSSLMTDCDVPTLSAMPAWVSPPDSLSSRSSDGQFMIALIIGGPMYERNRHADTLFLPFTQSRCMEPIGASLGERVRNLRKLRKLTQVRLAEALGIAQGSLSDIETGVTKEVSGKVLAGLCDTLTTTPGYLMTGGADLAPTEEDRRRMAELTKLAQDMGSQALSALLQTARTVARATQPAATKLIAAESDETPYTLVTRRDDRPPVDSGLRLTRAQKQLRAEIAARSGSKRAKKA